MSRPARLAAACLALTAFAIAQEPSPSLPAFVALTDGATVTLDAAVSSSYSASLTFTAHGGNRTLNVSGLQNGGMYSLLTVQDTSGTLEGLALGTGCTWRGANGQGPIVTLTTGKSAVDLMTFSYDGTNCNWSIQNNYTPTPIVLLSYVGQAAISGSPTSQVITVSIAKTGDASVLMAAFCGNSGCTSQAGCTVSALGGPTWSSSGLTNSAVSNVTEGGGWFYILPLAAVNATAGTYTVTVTVAGSGCSLNYFGFFSVDFINAATSSPFDPTAYIGGSAGSGVASSFSVNTNGNISGSGEIACATLIYGPAPTVSAPFTTLGNLASSLALACTQNPTPGVPLTFSGTLASSGIYVTSLFAVMP